MSKSEKVYFMNGKKWTKPQMVRKGIEQCMMSANWDGYETQCADCPFYDPDCTVEDCQRNLKETALELLDEFEELKKKIVQCKDCKSHNRCEIEGLFITNPYWFCAAGERRCEDERS